MSNAEDPVGGGGGPVLPENPLPRPVAASWRERITALAGAEITPVRVVAACLLTVGLVVAGWAVLRPPPAPPPPELSLPVASSSSTAATSTTLADIVVHAAGALQAPGLYRLHPGARIADLIEAAGGPAPDADMSGVNLAAPLADGQRFYVPRVGETPPTELPGGGPVVGAAGSDGAPSEPVNLNTATGSELEDLPGVGPTTAAAIIAYREEHGGFRRVDELLDVRGIGPARYEQLRSLVTV